MSDRELAWAAGLFEGEGFFSRNGLHYAVAGIAMTDEDAIRRFHKAVGFGKVHGPTQRGEHKPQWRWDISGFEKVQYLLCLLWFGLGDRRRTRATEVLAATPYTPKTHCRRSGHEMSEANTYVNRKTGSRSCVTCRRAASRRWAAA